MPRPGIPRRVHNGGARRTKVPLPSCLGAPSPAHQHSCVQAGRRRGAEFLVATDREVMSIPKAIDQIVEAFIPEMERISRMDESEEQKQRHYKAWLRATLQRFADEVREIEARNGAEGSRGHHAA